MGGRKRRDANPCTDGRGGGGRGGGGNREDEVTRGLQGGSWDELSHLPVCCCEDEKGLGIWPVICGVSEPSFSAVRMRMVACASPGEKKREIHVPSSWLSIGRRCLS